MSRKTSTTVKRSTTRPSRLRELGLEFERRRRLELAAHGIVEEILSTEELQAEAREAQIPGRSQMTREKLVKVVRESGR